MSRRLLLVDLSNVLYRAVAVHRSLSFEGQFTGGLYGFLAIVAKSTRMAGANQILICEDVKPYRRSIEYPAYKTLRKKDADPDLIEGFRISYPLVIKLCEVLGWPILSYPGFESDDCVASITLSYQHRCEAIFADSNDSDLFQLLDVEAFKLIRGGELFDRERLAAMTFGLTPQQYMLAQALMGTHNDVEGIPRVGLVTAVKAVKDPAQLRKLRERWGDLIDRNVRLSRLPHRDMPQVSMPEKQRVNLRHLYSYLARFDIEATKAMVDMVDQVNA